MVKTWCVSHAESVDHIMCLGDVALYPVAQRTQKDRCMCVCVRLTHSDTHCTSVGVSDVSPPVSAGDRFGFSHREGRLCSSNQILGESRKVGERGVCTPRSAQVWRTGVFTSFCASVPSGQSQCNKRQRRGRAKVWTSIDRYSNTGVTVSFHRPDRRTPL